MSNWNRDNYPDHDFGTPASEAAFMRAWRSLTDYDTNPRCSHCTEQRLPIPMSGSAWGWERFHAESCPQHEDSHEVVAIRVTENFNGAEYMEAEAIWSASQDEH